MKASDRGPAVPRIPIEGLRRLARDEPLVLRISGDCMAPAIADGALVEVAPRRLYWPGDVLVFLAADGRLTAHRLLGVLPWRGGMRLLTGADRAKTPDTAIAGSQVIGRILGGDCAPTVVRVPWEQRLTALGRLARWAVTRTLRHDRGRLRSHPIAPR